MNDKTWGIVVMGTLLVAFGLFASWMAGRQQRRDQRRKP